MEDRRGGAKEGRRREGEEEGGEDGTSKRILRWAVLEGRTGRVFGEWARREVESEGGAVFLVLREVRCCAKGGEEEEEEEKEEEEEEGKEGAEGIISTDKLLFTFVGVLFSFSNFIKLISFNTISSFSFLIFFFILKQRNKRRKIRKKK